MTKEFDKDKLNKGGANQPGINKQQPMGGNLGTGRQGTHGSAGGTGGASGGFNQNKKDRDDQGRTNR